VQCDSIAYIAYGKKLLDAPTTDIPKQIGLACWRIEGRPLQQAQAVLEKADGVELVARFGAAIHICGHNDHKLELAAQAVVNQQPHLKAARIEAGFEEIFIYLMAESRDNFQ
jgi:ABC-2 type transport system ATP-binding protein